MGRDDNHIGKKMNNVLNRVLTAIEESRKETFEMADNLQRECARMEDELKDLKVKTKANTESDDFQIQLLNKSQVEEELARERKELENLLRDSRSSLEQAERLTVKFSVALDFIDNNMDDFNDTITDLKQRHLLGRKIVQVQEDERRRVSREIHDGPAQTISNILLKIDLCEKLMYVDLDRAKAEIASLKQVVRNSTKEIRKTIYNLRPMAIDNLGLEPALRRYVEDFEADTGILIEVEVKHDLAIEDTIQKLALFRVMQEALRNVHKHANATRCHITLLQDQHQIILKVHDNGTGFDVSSVQIRKDSGFGIMGMKERIELLKGSIRIESSDGEGTTLTAVLPLHHQEGYHE